MTNVYGPSEDAKKLEFIDEMRSIQALVSTSWVFLGDFNMVRWYVDRSADMMSYGLMCAFNDMI